MYEKAGSQKRRDSAVQQVQMWNELELVTQLMCLMLHNDVLIADECNIMITVAQM